MTRSDSSFLTVATEKEGMIPKGIGLLFFVFVLAAPMVAEDYQVQKGDTVSAIALKNRIPSDLLQRANPELDWKSLQPGDRMVIPDRYTVKSGDTLYSLCRIWGVEQSAVLALNGLAGPLALRSGQVVFIPGKLNKGSSDASGLFWPVDQTPKPEGDKLKSVSFGTSGEPFRSVCSGTVVYQGEFRGVGRVLMVQRDDKTIFAFGNFEASAVDFGQTVARGQVLGTTSSRPSQRLSFFAFRQTEPLNLFSLKR